MYVGYDIHWDTGFTLTLALFTSTPVSRLIGLTEPSEMTSQQSPTVSTIEDTPPFIPEQLAWIDRLMAARQSQTPHCPPGTDPPASVSTLDRVVLPLGHTLAGPCSLLATHLQGRVPLLPHTYRAVFPSCHTLAGPCSPLATHLQGRVFLSPHTCGAMFPSCHTPTGIYGWPNLLSERHHMKDSN